MTCVAHAEGPLDAHQQSGAASRFPLDRRCGARRVEQHVALYTLAAPDLQHECILNLVHGDIEPRGAKSHRELLPITVAFERERIPALYKQSRTRAWRCPKLECCDAVSQLTASPQRSCG